MRARNCCGKLSCLRCDDSESDSDADAPISSCRVIDGSVDDGAAHGPPMMRSVLVHAIKIVRFYRGGVDLELSYQFRSEHSGSIACGG